MESQYSYLKREFVKLKGGPYLLISMEKRFWFVEWRSSLNRRFVKLSSPLESGIEIFRNFPSSIFTISLENELFDIIIYNFFLSAVWPGIMIMCSSVKL